MRLVREYGLQLKWAYRTEIGPAGAKANVWLARVLADEGGSHSLLLYAEARAQGEISAEQIACFYYENINLRLYHLPWSGTKKNKHTS